MKDKEKQIEEMGKDVCENINTKMCANGTCPKIWDCPYSNTMAEILIEKGYRKLPKDSIVLSREEYELYDIVKKCYPNNMSCLAEKFTEIDHKARKETAEKIYRMADEICTGSQNDGCNILAMIKQQFGVEIKE